MAQKPETKFRQKVDLLLHNLPNSWFESIQQKCIRGTPDKIGCINGHFVALELKASDHSPISHLQDYKIAQIRKAHGHGYIVTPTNLSIVMETLTSLALGDIAR